MSKKKREELKARFVMKTERPQEGKPEQEYQEGQTGLVYTSYTHIIENSPEVGDYLLVKGQKVKVAKAYGPCWDVQAGCWDPNSTMYDVEWGEGKRALVYESQLVSVEEWDGPSVSESVETLKKAIELL